MAINDLFNTNVTREEVQSGARINSAASVRAKAQELATQMEQEQAKAQQISTATQSNLDEKKLNIALGLEEKPSVISNMAKRFTGAVAEGTDALLHPLDTAEQLYDRVRYGKAKTEADAITKKYTDFVNTAGQSNKTTTLMQMQDALNANKKYNEPVVDYWYNEGAKDAKEAAENSFLSEERRANIQSNREDSELLGKTGQFFAGLAESAGFMVPSIITGNVAGALTGSSAVINAAALGTMWQEVYNRDLTSLTEQGYDWVGASDKAFLDATIETATEMLGSGVPGVKGSKGVIDPVLDATVGRVASKVNKSIGTKIATKLGEEAIEKGVADASKGVIISGLTGQIAKGLMSSTGEFITGMLGEGAEEVISAYLEPYVDRMTINPEAENATVGELGLSFLSGAVMGGFFNAFTLASNQAQSQGKTVLYQNGKVTVKDSNAVTEADVAQQNEEIRKVESELDSIFTGVENNEFTNKAAKAAEDLGLNPSSVNDMTMAEMERLVRNYDAKNANTSAIYQGEVPEGMEATSNRVFKNYKLEDLQIDDPDLATKMSNRSTYLFAMKSILTGLTEDQAKSFGRSGIGNIGALNMRFFDFRLPTNLDRMTSADIQQWYTDNVVPAFMKQAQFEQRRNGKGLMNEELRVKYAKGTSDTVFANRDEFANWVYSNVPVAEQTTEMLNKAYDEYDRLISEQRTKQDNFLGNVTEQFARFGLHAEWMSDEEMASELGKQNAFFDPETNTVKFNRASITTAEAARVVVAHEIVHAIENMRNARSSEIPRLRGMIDTAMHDLGMTRSEWLAELEPVYRPLYKDMVVKMGEAGATFEEINDKIDALLNEEVDAYFLQLVMLNPQALLTVADKDTALINALEAFVSTIATSDMESVLTAYEQDLAEKLKDIQKIAEKTAKARDKMLEQNAEDEKTVKFNKTLNKEAAKAYSKLRFRATKDKVEYPVNGVSELKGAKKYYADNVSTPEIWVHTGNKGISEVTSQWLFDNGYSFDRNIGMYAKPYTVEDWNILGGNMTAEALKAANDEKRNLNDSFKEAMKGESIDIADSNANMNIDINDIFNAPEEVAVVKVTNPEIKDSDKIKVYYKGVDGAELFGANLYSDFLEDIADGNEDAIVKIVNARTNKTLFDAKKPSKTISADGVSKVDFTKANSTNFEVQSVIDQAVEEYKSSKATQIVRATNLANKVMQFNLSKDMRDKIIESISPKSKQELNKLRNALSPSTVQSVMEPRYMANMSDVLRAWDISEPEYTNEYHPIYMEDNEYLAFDEERNKKAQELGLSEYQRDLVKDYIDGKLSYKYDWRQSNPAFSDRYNTAKELVKALEKFPKYEGIAYRELGWDKASELQNIKDFTNSHFKPGDTLRYTWFTSLSKSPNVYTPPATSVRAHLVMLVKNAADVSDTLAWPQQQEIILLPGTPFDIIDVKEANDGWPLILLEEAENERGFRKYDNSKYNATDEQKQLAQQYAKNFSQGRKLSGNSGETNRLDSNRGADAESISSILERVKKGLNTPRLMASMSDIRRAAAEDYYDTISLSGDPFEITDDEIYRNFNRLDDELERQWEKAQEDYGTYRYGTPKKTVKGATVSRVADNILSDEALPEQLTQEARKNILNGIMSFTRMPNLKTEAEAKSYWNKKIWYNDKGEFNISKALEDWSARAESGSVGTPEAVAQGFILWAKIKDAAATRTLTDDELIMADRLTTDVAMVSTNIARSLQIFKALNKMTGDGRVYYVERMLNELKAEINQANNFFAKGAKNALDDYTIPEDLSKLLRTPMNNELISSAKISETLRNQLTEAQTLTERLSLVEEAIKDDVASNIPPTVESRITAWRMLSMLGNIRTHLRNIVSNAAMYITRNIRDVETGVIEDVFLKDGNYARNTSFTNKASTALKQLSLSQYQIHAKEIQAGGKLSFKADVFQRANSYGNTTAGKFLEKLGRWNSELLESEDAWFLRANFRQAFASYAQANAKRWGVTADGIVDFLTADTMQSREALNECLDHATTEAKRATYREASNLASWLNAQEKKGTLSAILIEGVLPFKRTPINILKQGARYSPIGIMNAVRELTLGVKSGEIGSSYIEYNEDGTIKATHNKTVADAISDLCAGMTGTMIMGLGLFLGGCGAMKAGGSDSDREEKYDEMLGNQKYSITIGDTNITLDWLTPISMPLFAGVSLAEALGGQDATEEDDIDFLTNFNYVLAALGDMADPFTNLSLLSGVNEALNSYSDDKLGALASSAAGNYVSQFIPTLAGQIARTMDGTRRTTYAPKDSDTLGGQTGARFLNKLKAKIPFLASTNAEYVDQWGRTEEYSSELPVLGDLGGVGRAINQMATPWYSKTVNNTEVDDRLAGIFEASKDSTVLPSTPQSYYTIDGEKYYLDANEYTDVKKTVGQLSYAGVDSFFKSTWLNNLTVDEQADAIGNIYSYAKAVAKNDFATQSSIEGYEAESIISKVDAAQKAGLSIGDYFVLKKLLSDDVAGTKNADKKKVARSLGLNSTQTDLFLKH